MKSPKGKSVEMSGYALTSDSLKKKVNHEEITNLLTGIELESGGNGILIVIVPFHNHLLIYTVLFSPLFHSF